MQIRIGTGFWSSRFGLGVLGVALAALLAATAALVFYYIQFGRLINERLTGQIFQNTSRVYSAPGGIYVGETMRPGELASYLLRAGYQEGSVPGSAGEYRVTSNAVEIRPSADSYFRGSNALRVEFTGPAISRIAQIPGGLNRDSAQIEPELLTNLFDSSREKRRVVRFEDLPPILVNAVLSAEDKRFFEHGGLDFVRVVGAALADLRTGQKAQGASTIDMQVARSFFFTTKREWRRKAKEILMAFELDERFLKRQIFELYANEVYLGNRGSFAIRGFGEAAEAYFGKDVRELNLGEAAFLAGIIRAPNRYSGAERHPERAVEARDRVLGQMLENSYATADQVAAAKKAKLHFVAGSAGSGSAPYFVDMVKDHLLEHFSETDLETQSYRIYTTLDPTLERAAGEALQAGMVQVDKLLAKRYAAWQKKGEPVPQAQIALVAMDPRTGEIRALVGGRDYGESQLNHALAHRQPGSAFKPFVYAAAFDNAVQGFQPVVTPVTTVDDIPTTFEFSGKEYTPDNFGEVFYGTVTVRDALIHSLNVATVKVAELIGYQRVVDVARQMGLGNNIQATPSVALGAYDMTPIDVAAGYTAFATNGTRAEPLFIRSVLAADGAVEESANPRTRPVLDPRVAFLVTSLMEDVINRGTGASVRALGFNAPAAGKTGTSRDGWFAGFTSNLLCVVWIGFDDYRDLGLSGSQTAAPVWAEFMKRAITLPGYRDPQFFEPPAGVIEMQIDPQTGGLATSSCPQSELEYFVAGTEPTQFCELHGGGHLAQTTPGSWLAHLFGKPSNPQNAPGAPNSPPGASNPSDPSSQGRMRPRSATNAGPGESAQPPEEEKKKGLLDKIFGIFGGNKKPADTTGSHP
ncbi:MAG TPA: PBP1A family penicillin-binding protein [Candidatus Sulfotelmatobacter sp.]|nr:PBP1A family penicillin-binding protein [Candidatus Sulfotelmatobacter sp.]